MTTTEPEIDQATRRAPLSFAGRMEMYLLDCVPPAPTPVERFEGASEKQEPARWSQLMLIAVIVLSLCVVGVYEAETIRVFLGGLR